MGKRKIKGDKELEKIAEMFKSLGLSSGEQYRAIFQFKEYKDSYHIESYSDLQLLSELVFREILQERCKTKIGTVDKSKNVKEQKIIPVAVMKALDDNLDRMLTIREKLGLFSDKKVDDPFEHLQTLEKKFEKHREENAGDYSIPCPFCSKMIFLMFKVKNYEAKKHPFFKGKFLVNDELWKLYKEGRLTKEDLANIFQTSSDYIDWLEAHIYNKDSNNPSN